MPDSIKAKMLILAQNTFYACQADLYAFYIVSQPFRD